MILRAGQPFRITGIEGTDDTVSAKVQTGDDKALPASHTVEVMFTLPPNFAHGGITNIPGVLMKQSEDTRGVALAGLAVKVTNNFFLIGLSTVEADRTRNIQLLKEKGWFDIPVVYNDGRRAIIAIEKGTPGDRAFEVRQRPARGLGHDPHQLPPLGPRQRPALDDLDRVAQVRLVALVVGVADRPLFDVLPVLRVLDGAGDLDPTGLGGLVPCDDPDQGATFVAGGSGGGGMS